MLVTNSFTCYNYTSVATSVPATTFHLALAKPGQPKHCISKAHVPSPFLLHWLLPCPCTFFFFGKSKPGHYTSLSSLTKVRQLPMLFYLEQHKVFAMDHIWVLPLQNLQQPPGCLKTAVTHTKTCAKVSPMSLAPLMLSMHIAQNVKAYMPYSWPSRASVLSMPLPLGQSLWDVIIWELFTKLSKTRSSHHVALPMQISSELSTRSISPSQESQFILSTWRATKKTYSHPFPPCPAGHNSISWQTNLQSDPSSGFSSTASAR